MARIFAYARVSTVEQNTQNQIHEIQSAGFDVLTHRIVEEEISGSVSASRRPELKRLLDRMEQGDVLVVTKLDRLGRDAVDVSQTVSKLEDMGVRLHCLALGGLDLTSAAGKMTMGVINAMAQFERDLLIERTQAGLQRAKSQGKSLGRPRVLSDKQKLDVKKWLNDGSSISAIAREFQVSRQTVMRVRDGN